MGDVAEDDYNAAAAAAIVVVVYFAVDAGVRPNVYVLFAASVHDHSLLYLMLLLLLLLL